MQASTQRHKPVRLFFRRLLLLVLFIFVLLGMSSVWNIYVKERESAVLKQQSQAALVDLTTRQKQLQSNIADLKTNRGMEAALRQQYDMGKSGEGMIMIIDASTSAPVAATSSSAFKQWINKAFPWW